jgi:(R,R)-butanediol dehydrogenase/meso-butanediol dehydrogenase/diacetyl reductase
MKTFFKNGIEEGCMKAAVYHGIRDLRVEEVEEPKPGKKEAKIKVRYCGICGSDLHEYLHGLFPESPFGHEACGEIIEAGPGLEGFKVKDRVMAFSKDGYAEYMVCPQEEMIKLPEGMGWKRAAVVEPLSVAAYCIKRTGVRPTDRVLITGAGPVGLMLLMGLKAIGVKEVYMTEISEGRRKKAQELGATEVFNPLEVRVSSRMKELTEGKGVDIAIEAVGIEESLKDCLSSLKYRGKVTVAGIFTDRVRFNMLGFVYRETTMIGTNSNDAELALDWIIKKGLAPEKIVTKIIPLEHISTEGFEVLTARKGDEIKVLVEP